MLPVFNAFWFLKHISDTMIIDKPLPHNELDRIVHLSDFDLDYSSFKQDFKDLATLAAHIAGTDVSLVNLIDSYTQWTVSGYGLDIEQMPREDSVCQYTIAGNDTFEVADLRTDERFKDKSYVVGGPMLRYYFGVPLTSAEGHNLGALCVLDKEYTVLTPEKIDLLKLIANEIINRLKAARLIGELNNKLLKDHERLKKVAHDIRSPLSGIIGLAGFIHNKGKHNKLDEVLEFIDLIQKSGKSLIDLTDEIMNAKKSDLQDHLETNLNRFKNKLETLFQPQAKSKNIALSFYLSAQTSATPFLKNKLLQITGNLIANALKFTPEGGAVTVGLSLDTEADPFLLTITVDDNGIGMENKTIAAVFNGTVESQDGTGGEHGFGFGLALVKNLVDKLNGHLQIHSQKGKGTRFEIALPVGNG